MRVTPYIFLLGALLLMNPTYAVGAVTCEAGSDNETQTELQARLVQCEEEIAHQNSLITETQRQTTSLERDIDVLNYQIAKTNLEIRARTLKIQKLKDDITVKNNTLGALVLETKRKKIVLAELLRKTHEIDQASLVGFLLGNETLSGFYHDVDSFAAIEDGLKSAFSEIQTTKSDTEKTKATLEDRQEQEQGLKLAQENEQAKAKRQETEKQRLLSDYKGKEEAYRQEVTRREQVIQDIKNRIFRTVGGGEMRFEDALKLVQAYEDIIGVRSALVLAILTQESAIDGVIGRNLGKCYYNDSRVNSSGSVMSNTQKPSFLAIVGELGMNPASTPVSCPITSDGAYGGAMGPAQFMPKTWWDIDSGFGYKKRVANVVGVSVPSPFTNLDAFTGTALYLKDAMTRCKTAFSRQFDIESCTAAKYYAGIGAAGSLLTRHMSAPYSYGYRVATRAVSLQKDIDLIEF